MRIEVTARHFKAPKELRTFVEKEVRKLTRYFDGVIDCHVVLSHDNGQEVAEIIAHSKKHQFTAIQGDQKMDRAVVLAVEKLKTQITRYKEKLIEKQP
ncbi:MAG: ribosome-associated translation inhibitor RaiA [Fidelibacterota bacterium]|nr:MAG: ribosome-associated translation inhibitor RaiA [Candidatus Neomarinimicrobiota bacterium]